MLGAVVKAGGVVAFAVILLVTVETVGILMIGNIGVLTAIVTFAGNGD